MSEKDDATRAVPFRVVAAKADEPSDVESASAASSKTEEPAQATATQTTNSNETTTKHETSEPEIDLFFARSFALDEERRENDSVGDAFAGGLRSIFAAEFDSDDETNGVESDAESNDKNGDPDADATNEKDVESDAERFQRDLAAERRESLDGVLLQNDAEFLYEAGAKYERPQSNAAEFGRRANAEKSARSDAAALSENESVDATERRVAITPTSILEAMLFVGDRDSKPLTLARATELMRNVSETEALEALADLNERYFRNGAPYRIVRNGAGYRMTLRSEFDEIAAKFAGKTKEFKLSQPAIDVLALVAYKQPITLEEILEIRNNAANVLSQLVKRDLVAIEKRTVDKKKISFYKTTPRFLKLFHLESLDDLPIVGDVDYR